MPLIDLAQGKFGLVIKDFSTYEGRADILGEGALLLKPLSREALIFEIDSVEAIGIDRFVRRVHENGPVELRMAAGWFIQGTVADYDPADPFVLLIRPTASLASAADGCRADPHTRRFKAQSSPKENGAEDCFETPEDDERENEGEEWKYGREAFPEFLKEGDDEEADAEDGPWYGEEMNRNPAENPLAFCSAVLVRKTAIADPPPTHQDLRLGTPGALD